MNINRLSNFAPLIKFSLSVRSGIDFHLLNEVKTAPALVFNSVFNTLFTIDCFSTLILNLLRMLLN